MDVCTMQCYCERAPLMTGNTFRTAHVTCLEVLIVVEGDMVWLTVEDTTHAKYSNERT